MPKHILIPPLTLLAMVLAGAQLAAGSAKQSGAQLVQERCTQCHSAGRIQQAKKDRAAWEATVARMMGKRPGLLNAEEQQAVLEHLAGR
jgi:cytochrome c5